MAEDNPTVARRVLRALAEIAVAIYVVLNGVIAPLFRPIMRGLSGLRPIQTIERVIARLPPYVILVLLVVPFGFAELAKVYAVLLMAEDHFKPGMTIFIGAYIVSILVCERTFHAGKGQLMTIGWFKALFDWIMVIKERVLGWFAQTRVWRASAEIRENVGVVIQRVRARLQSPFVAKQKRSLEHR